MLNKIISLIIFSLLIVHPTLASDTTGNSGGYSWAERFGFTSFSGSNAPAADYGVDVGNASLTGYTWNESAGYVNMNDTGALYGVLNDGAGNLSGYAWSEKLGYISFDDSSANNYYHVTIDSHGNFSGYAWSELAGYVNMSGGDYYNATTTWTPIIKPTLSTHVASNISTSSVNLFGEIVDWGNSAITEYGFQFGTSVGAAASSTESSLSGQNITANQGFNFTITGLASRTTYYFRAYALNSEGYGYGDWAAFTTGASSAPVILKQGVILKPGTVIK